jgi:hypothetical protein
MPQHVEMHWKRNAGLLADDLDQPTAGRSVVKR